MCSLPSLCISAVSLGTPENSAIEKLSIITIYNNNNNKTHSFNVLCIVFPKMKHIAHYKTVNRSENSLGTKPTTIFGPKNSFWPQETHM